MSSFFRNLLNGVLVLTALVAPAEAFAGTTMHASYYRNVTVRTYAAPPPAPVIVHAAPVAQVAVQVGVPCAPSRCWGGRCVRPCRQAVRCRPRCGGFAQRIAFRGCRGRRCF